MLLSPVRPFPGFLPYDIIANPVQLHGKPVPVPDAQTRNQVPIPYPPQSTRKRPGSDQRICNRHISHIVIRNQRRLPVIRRFMPDLNPVEYNRPAAFSQSIFHIITVQKERERKILPDIFHRIAGKPPSGILSQSAVHSEQILPHGHIKAAAFMPDQAAVPGLGRRELNAPVIRPEHPPGYRFLNVLRSDQAQQRIETVQTLRPEFHIVVHQKHMRNSILLLIPSCLLHSP